MSVTLKKTWADKCGLFQGSQQDHGNTELNFDSEAMVNFKDFAQTPISANTLKHLSKCTPSRYVSLWESLFSNTGVAVPPDMVTCMSFAVLQRE